MVSISPTTVFIFVNLIGGIVVLASYSIGLIRYPDSRNALWGGVQGTYKTVFIISMIPATLGYLMFFYYMVFESVIDGFDHTIRIFPHSVSTLCAFFLISSSIWMPATIAYLNSKKILWWIAVITTLWISAISILLLTLSIGFLQSEPRTVQWIIGSIGISYVAFHCVVLDAIIWIKKFR